MDWDFILEIRDIDSNGLDNCIDTTTLNEVNSVLSSTVSVFHQTLYRVRLQALGYCSLI